MWQLKNKPEGEAKQELELKRIKKKVLYLAAQFERVDFLSLLAQSLIHTAQVVAHHAELVFVAPLSRSQLILRERPQLQVLLRRRLLSTLKTGRSLVVYLQACDVLIGQFDLLTQRLPWFFCNG